LLGQHVAGPHSHISAPPTAFHSVAVAVRILKCQGNGPAGDEDDWRSWKTVGDDVLHIELRRWADIMVIAPLSANTLAKVANGMCDNLLTCVVRAWDWQKPLLVRSCCPHKLFHVQD